jgi:stearoyl-CoA desaturase (delta-9 desaturase)
MNLISIPVGIIVAFYTSLYWLLFTFFWYRFVGIIFFSIGLHRYFAHRSFKTGPLRHKILALGSILTGAGSPIAFSASHTHHHKHSDKELDLHSPKDGAFHSCVSWSLNSKQWFFEEKGMIVPMFAVKDRFVNFVHKYYFSLWFLISLSLFLIDWKLFLFMIPVTAGIGTLTNNFVGVYIAHVKLPGSYKNFDTKDNSYNNQFVQSLEIAEGYHNNHHADPSNYNFARKPGEFDACAWIIERFFKI